MKKFRVPKATVGRLGIYSRYLTKLERSGILTVSSDEIGRSTGVSSSQVRKDLSYFGDVGVRGVGYNVRDLQSYTLRVLGLDRKWYLVIVGAGRLGCALAMYEGFTERGFATAGILDNDVAKIGTRVGHLTIRPVGDLPELVRRYGVRIGLIAVPAAAAQETADLMVASGLTAILNFALVPIDVPPSIVLPTVDLAFLLEAVSFGFSRELSGLVRGWSPCRSVVGAARRDTFPPGGMVGPE